MSKELPATSAQLRELRNNIIRNELRRVTPKQELKRFEDATMFQIVENESDEEVITNFFDLFNYLSFAGFDYYHYSGMADMINEGESIVGISSTLDVLINKDHLAKLRNVVNCFPELEFISSKEEGEKQSYAIWYKDTPARIDLIPFTRKDGNIVIELPNLDKDYKEELYGNVDTHNNIPFKQLSMLGYSNSPKEEITMKKALKR